MTGRLRMALAMLVGLSVGWGASACERDGGGDATQGAKASAASTADDGFGEFDGDAVDDTVPADDARPAHTEKTTRRETVDERAKRHAAEAADTPDEEDDENDPNDSCAPKTPGLKPMQVLRFTFTDGVEGKDPKGKLYVARPGQRVYAHFAMRNRSGRKRCLHITFRVAGKKRTAVTVPIGKSWEWRTYAYNTLRSDDRGPLELTVVDDQGVPPLKKLLGVVPKKKR